MLLKGEGKISSLSLHPNFCEWVVVSSEPYYSLSFLTEKKIENFPLYEVEFLLI